jgi:predicted phage tail protein
MQQIVSGGPTVDEIRSNYIDIMKILVQNGLCSEDSCDGSMLSKQLSWIREEIQQDKTEATILKEVDSSNVHHEMEAMRVEHNNMVTELQHRISALTTELDVAKSNVQLERLAAEQQRADCIHDLESIKTQLSDCRTTRTGVEKSFIAMQEAKCTEQLMAAKVNTLRYLSSHAPSEGINRIVLAGCAFQG